MSTKKVHNAHIRELLPELHRSLIEIVSMMNRPERDVELLAKAGLSLERALFPLLVLVERLGPIGVVDLAGRVGRDYTTVSRQRVREAIITPQGKAATDALDAAREGMAVVKFADWKREDLDDLVRLMRMLANTMSD